MEILVQRADGLSSKSTIMQRLGTFTNVLDKISDTIQCGLCPKLQEKVEETGKGGRIRRRVDPQQSRCYSPNQGAIPVFFSITLPCSFRVLFHPLYYHIPSSCAAPSKLVWGWGGCEVLQFSMCEAPVDIHFRLFFE